MVRAILENGEIRPLRPLPDDWQDGQKLLIETEAEDRPDAISAWAQEIEDAAQAIPEEDHRRFLEALEEQRTVSKDQVRRQMGLP